MKKTFLSSPLAQNRKCNDMVYYHGREERHNIPNAFDLPCSTMDRLALYLDFGNSFQTNLLVGTIEAGNCGRAELANSTSDIEVHSVSY